MKNSFVDQPQGMPRDAGDSPDPVLAPTSAIPPRPWPLRLRLAASALLLWHATALVAASLAVEPASALSGLVWRLYRPYLEASHLNHGYHFFAPEPGPSHLIRYEVTLADGTQQRGFFPDRQAHRPRLLYHRHFMLTEHLNTFTDADVPSELFTAYSASLARHLLHERQAEQVKLYLVRHLFPRPQDVLEGMALDDKSLYRERLLGVYPPPPLEAAPPSKADGPFEAGPMEQLPPPLALAPAGATL